MANDTNVELPTECCAKCKYAKIARDSEHPTDFSIRECHRLPPRPQVVMVPVIDQKTARPMGVNPTVHVLWARMSTKEWCGEFKHTEVARKPVENPELVA